MKAAYLHGRAHAGRAGMPSLTRAVHRLRAFGSERGAVSSIDGELGSVREWRPMAHDLVLHTRYLRQLHACPSAPAGYVARV